MANLLCLPLHDLKTPDSCRKGRGGTAVQNYMLKRREKKLGDAGGGHHERKGTDGFIKVQEPYRDRVYCKDIGTMWRRRSSKFSGKKWRRGRRPSLKSSPVATFQSFHPYP